MSGGGRACLEVLVVDAMDLSQDLTLVKHCKTFVQPKVLPRLIGHQIAKP